jgi:hypothetical protein
MASLGGSWEFFPGVTTGATGDQYSLSFGSPFDLSISWAFAILAIDKNEIRNL